MKILVIPENFPTNENPVAGIFMKDYLQALSSFSTVTVFNSNPWYRGMYEEVEGIRSFDLHLYSKKWSFPLNIAAYLWWERQTLKFAKKLQKPDLINLHGTAQRGKWAARLADYWKVPLIITEHTGPWSAISSRPHILRRVKRVLERADLVMPVSRYLKSEILESGVSPKQIKVLGNPVDSDFFTLRTTPLTSQKRILFLGRLDPFKGGLRTLKAFSRIKDEFPEYRLTIAGDGPEASQIENFVSHNELDDRVEFMRKQHSRSEMLQLFHDSSFLVFPSEFESFGLVAAEAMSTGLPVVITNKTGPVDFSNSKNSIPIDPHDIEIGLKKMIEKLDLLNPTIIRESLDSAYGLTNWSRRILRELTDLS